MGRTTAIVMITAMLDELFYIVMVPVVILVIGMDNLFIGDAGFLMNLGGKQAFIFGYSFILILTLVITSAIFIVPTGARTLNKISPCFAKRLGSVVNCLIFGNLPPKSVDP